MHPVAGAVVHRAARVLPCECGGVVAVPTAADGLAQARIVYVHNASLEHTAYRWRRAQDGEPAELLGRAAAEAER